MYKKLLVILMLCFTAVIYGNDRKIIKAYEKGKPAEMKIEVTKVKSDNYLDLIIDRLNKKFYKDITGENTDLKRKLYITDTLERITSVADLRNEYPYKVVEYNGKKYLEVDYLGKPEPENIYFWVTKGNKIKKLYTGEVVDEYLDLTRAEAHVILKEEQSEKGKFDKISEESIIIKIGEIEHRKESQEAIRLSVAQNRYVLKGEETGGIIPVELYFDKEGTKEIVLDKNNRKTTLYGKIDVNTKDDYNLEKYNLVDDKNSNGSFSIKADFTSKLLSRSAVNSGYVNTVYKLNPRAIVREGGSVGEIIHEKGKLYKSGKIKFTKFAWWATVQVDIPNTMVKLNDNHFDLGIISNFNMSNIKGKHLLDRINFTKNNNELIIELDYLSFNNGEYKIKYLDDFLIIRKGKRENLFEGRVVQHMSFGSVNNDITNDITANAIMLFIGDPKWYGNDNITYKHAEFKLLNSRGDEIKNGKITLVKSRNSEGELDIESQIEVELSEAGNWRKYSRNKYIHYLGDGNDDNKGRYQITGLIKSEQLKNKVGEYVGTITMQITAK